MENKPTVLTPEGKARLEEELRFREDVERDRIAKNIAVAKDFGDLSENAEYDAAREEQAQNESRINEISAILANSVVQHLTARNRGEVNIGSTVVIAMEDGQTRTLKIVGTTETNSLKGRISNESPVGGALMGKRVGEEVPVTSPDGLTRVYKVESISQ